MAALLRTRRQSVCSTWKTVGLVDPRSPKLPDECASWVDEVSSSLNPVSDGAPAVFIDGTPMTHDTRFSLRFLAYPAFLRAAVIYDFIPLEWPGYLPSIASRIDYLAKMARLRKFDLFLPISEYSAWRLSELLGISPARISVTGASVRRSLYELRQSEIASSPYDAIEPYFLVVIASDPRKNPEAAVKAVRHLNLLYSRRIALRVIGHYDEAFKGHLLRFAGHAEGDGFLEFHQGISDQELVAMFAGAIATIAPSHVEGFSLPIVEASVCGCPVIASTCAAHLELIEQTEALFPSDDSIALSEKLDALLNEPSLQASLVASQAHLGAKFHENAVGERFWSAIGSSVENRPTNAVFTRPPKPRLAFLSVFPPDRSGVARYTAMTIQAGKKLFDSDIYSDAARPLTLEGRVQDGGKISLAPLLRGRYNGIISVLGNHSGHLGIFEVFERYGGPCILHDSRLTGMFFHGLGQVRFLDFANKLLGRSVSMEEVDIWLQDRNLPSLFLEPVIERASPLIVHTPTQEALLKKRYGADVHLATCCPTNFFEEQELTAAVKEAARRRHGISPSVFLVSTFGAVARVRGMEACILAIELLRSWNIPAELYFVGNADIHKREVDRISKLYEIGAHVHAYADFVDEVSYRDFLLASDAAVQLRTYGFGQFSAALTDCISAGLPCVANSDLAESCSAPGYVLRVPDRFSPLQVAEQLALIWERRNGRASYSEERAMYLETHNFEYYGKRLLEILGIA